MFYFLHSHFRLIVSGSRGTGRRSCSPASNSTMISCSSWTTPESGVEQCALRTPSPRSGPQCIPLGPSASSGLSPTRRTSRGPTTARSGAGWTPRRSVPCGEGARGEDTATRVPFSLMHTPQWRTLFRLRGKSNVGAAWGRGCLRKGVREEELGSWARLAGESFLWLH